VQTQEFYVGLGVQRADPPCEERKGFGAAASDKPLKQRPAAAAPAELCDGFTQRGR